VPVYATFCDEGCPADSLQQGDMMKIVRVSGREIIDARALPTIECVIELSDGRIVTASVPTGTSRGRHEAHELRDGGARFLGTGVLQSVEKINKVIQPYLVGREPNLIQTDIQMLDLDGTDEKSVLGANTMLAVGMAVARAQAAVEELKLYELLAYLCGFEEISLPSPLINMISGGVHVDNNLQVQELMVIPIGMSSFRVAMEACVMVFHVLQELLRKEGKKTSISCEGAIEAEFSDETEAMDFLQAAIDHVQSGYEGQIMMALDVAATQFYNTRTKKYTWHGQQVDANGLIEWYGQLLDKYPIYSIEDGLSEDDWDGWQEMSRRIGSRVQLVGDDLFASDPRRIWQGIENEAANAVLIKPNQIGTVTEALQSVKLCHDNDLRFVVSHRSGETNDTFIADMAVGTSSGQIKAGGCTRGERVAKYNRLLTIEDELLLVF